MEQKVWLDRHGENSFGQLTQERVSNLLDQLLNKGDPINHEHSRIQKIKKSLMKAPRNRASARKEPNISIIIPAYNKMAYDLAWSIYGSNPSNPIIAFL